MKNRKASFEFCSTFFFLNIKNFHVLLLKNQKDALQNKNWVSVTNVADCSTVV